MSTIQVWKHGNVYIYPHLEFSHLYSYEEIKQIVLNIKKYLFSELIIYDESSYTYDLNGRWNICFSINKNKIDYTYLIRRDHLTKKTYACPFNIYEYGNTNMINKNTCRTEFDILEHFLVSNYNGKHITEFPC